MFAGCFPLPLRPLGYRSIDALLHRFAGRRGSEAASAGAPAAYRSPAAACRSLLPHTRPMEEDGTMIRIMARITARPGWAEKLQPVLEELAAASRHDAGCLGYELLHNQDDASEFVTVEQWSDQTAADAHLATAHVARAIERAGELLAQPPLIHRFRRLA